MLDPCFLAQTETRRTSGKREREKPTSGVKAKIMGAVWLMVLVPFCPISHFIMPCQAVATVAVVVTHADAMAEQLSERVRTSERDHYGQRDMHDEHKKT